MVLFLWREWRRFRGSKYWISSSFFLSILGTNGSLVSLLSVDEKVFAWNFSVLTLDAFKTPTNEKRQFTKLFSRSRSRNFSFSKLFSFNPIYLSVAISNLKLFTKSIVPKIKVKVALEMMVIIKVNSKEAWSWMGDSYHGCNICDKFRSWKIFEVMEAAITNGVRIIIRIRLHFLDFQLMIMPAIM